jgi:uncharacterized membrane protein YfcA
MFVVFCASFIGGFSGFGTSTIALPILFYFFPPQQALFLVAIVHLSLDVGKMVFFRRGFVWSLIISFGIPALIGSFIGALLVVHIDQTHLARLVGLFLIGYVLFLLYRPSFSIPQNRFFAILGGALSGLSGGLIGMQGALRSAFLRGYNLSKESYLAVGAVIGFLVDCARIVSYWKHGIQLPISLWQLAIFLMPATVLGVYCARLVVGRINHVLFMKWVSIALLLVGLKLLINP